MDTLPQSIPYAHYRFTCSVCVLSQMAAGFNIFLMSFKQQSYKIK